MACRPTTNRQNNSQKLGHYFQSEIWLFIPSTQYKVTIVKNHISEQRSKLSHNKLPAGNSYSSHNHHLVNNTMLWTKTHSSSCERLLTN